jgi:ABC-type Mn2+/Zn2+ transport system permease subunit
MSILKKLLSREFLIGAGLFALLILNFERSYGLSEEVTAGIVAAMIFGAGWRLAQKANE